jgi:sterol desaturase/sphingolipid hydroxylase (fatty acid hydroxylase superfamily)
VSVTDPYTAPAEAVPTRRAASGPSLRDCLRAFARQPSPPALLLALLGALALRIALGHWSWRDLVILAGLLIANPFVEWAIHVYLLHSRPLRIAGRKVDLITTREHRAHHENPGELDGVLIPLYGVAAFLPMIAVTVVALSFPVHLLLGGDRTAGAATGLLVAWTVLALYEWTHFLIHTPYRPRHRYYRAIWRNHRLHHYKNERYWYGVTSTFGDRVIGTRPDQREVPRSQTARALHGDV